MKPQDFVKEYRRLHDEYKKGSCTECPLYELPCGTFTLTTEENFAKMYDVIEQWSDAHPVKTRQTEFLKQYPETRLESNGAIFIAPCWLSHEIGNNGHCDKWHNCSDCKKDFWFAPIN